MKGDSPENIFFFTESTNYIVRSKTALRDWLMRCAKSEKVRVGELNFIFCSDQYLRKINKQYLNHDYYTDIITFPTSLPGEKKISGDIFISIDRVRENAATYGVGINEELRRVMAHGLLHLCGYGDKTESEIRKIRTMENKWLMKYKF